MPSWLTVVLTWLSTHLVPSPDSLPGEWNVSDTVKLIASGSGWGAVAWLIFAAVPQLATILPAIQPILDVLSSYLGHASPTVASILVGVNSALVIGLQLFKFGPKALTK